jgi:hypothetical protein
MLHFVRSLWVKRRLKKRIHRFRQKRQTRLVLEGLEDRAVPSITFSGAGNSGIATLTRASGPDAVVIQLKQGDAATIEFSDDNGQTFTDATVSGITAIQVNGLGGANRVRINEANGLVAKSSGLPITFHGGHGHNVISIAGNPGVSVNETFTPGDSPYSGTLAMTDGTHTATITLQDVNHVFDTSTAASLTVNANDQNNFIHIGFGFFPNADGVTTNTVRVLDVHQIDDEGGQHDSTSMTGDPTETADGSADDNHMDDNPTERHFSGGIIPVTYANKTNVTVNGLGGDDLFLVAVVHAATGEQSLTLNGGTGFNVAAVRVFPHNVTLTLQNINRTVSDSASIFIHELYMSRLGRPAEDAAVAGWTQLLNTQGPAAVVGAIESSVEARFNLVLHLYVHYLGRIPTNAEAMGWVNALMSGMSEEQVLQAFLASDEFFARAQTLANTGDANLNFAQVLYQVTFKRTASTVEVTAWGIASATVGRSIVAGLFVNSPEFRTNAVISLYVSILHRTPDAVSLVAWVNSNLSLHDLRVDFLASAEVVLNG